MAQTATAMFAPQDQRRIDEARTCLQVTHDPNRRTLLVTGIPHRAWMLFKYEPDLHVEDMAANMRYDSLITGAPVPGWWATNAAWDAARGVLMQLCVDPTIPTAMHAPSRSKINGAVALVLATEDRIAQWGGFTGEREHLPALINQLNAADRKAYDRRKRGLVVL